MADNSISGLYMRLGLSLDELETDFIAAEKTTRENLARLNRESNLIRLRAEVEIGNLDETADAVQILTIRENALNEQLSIQRDKVKLAEAAYQDLINKHGTGAAVSQKAAAALEREKLALQRLQNELQNVRKAQDDLNKSQNSTKSSNGLLGDYKDLKSIAGGSLGKIAEGFNGIKSAAGSADGAITKSLEIIEMIPHPAGKAAAALAMLPLAMHGIENSLIDLAKPAISAGDAFYVMSRGMQMSIADTAKLSTICKVTGIEISEVISMSKRLTSQFAKADSKSPMMKMLGKYGVQVRDLNGDIKNTLDLSLALSEGLKKAQAEGRGREFINTVIGRSASGDIITYLVDLAANVEQAKKVVKNGLADPVAAHAMQGELNTLEAQAGQLNSAFSSAFMPLAEKIIPNTTQRLGELTKVVAQNADGIKALAEYTGAFVDKIGGAANAGLITLVQLMGSAGEFFKSSNKTVDKYLNDKNINSVEDLVHKELLNYQPLERLRIEKDPLLYQQTIEFFTPIYQAIADAREKIKAEGKEIGNDIRSSTYESFHALKGLSFENPEELRKSFEDTKKLRDELYKLTHSNYENQLLDALRWQEQLLQSETTTDEQRVIIAQITNEKIAQIEKQKADEIEKSQKRIQDLMQSAADIEYGLTHSAFEKQIYDIEQWEKKSLESIEKYKNALEDKGRYEEEAAAIAEEEAFKREMDRIQGRIESAQDRLMRLTSSQKDYDLYKAQKQYQEDLKYLPQGFAKALYDAEVAKINERARNDKGGSYSKSKNNSRGYPYIIEFDTPKQTDWTKINPQDLAFNTLAQNNRQLAESVRNVIGAQGDLIQSIHHTAEGFEIIEGDKVVQSSNNSNSSDHEIEIIEGDKVVKRGSISSQNADGIETIGGNKIVSAFNSSVQSIIDAQQRLQEPVKQTPDYNKYLQGSPDVSRGVPQSQIISYLDQINTRAEQLCEYGAKISTGLYQRTQQQSPNITVSPNINVDLGGAYVFDDAMKKQLTEDVTNEVVTAVKDAFQQAKDSSNYRYGN